MSGFIVLCKRKISSQKFGEDRAQTYTFVHRCLKILSRIDFLNLKKTHRVIFFLIIIDRP